MSAPFRFPKFFVTNPSPCPYLPGKVERKVFTELSGRHSSELNEALGRIGFRRSQSVAYRPSCIDCSACVSVRVLAAEFEATATQRKLLRRHADLEVSACRPWTTEEQYGLLRRYLSARHPGGGMAEMDVASVLTKMLQLRGFTLRPHSIEEKAQIVERFRRRWLPVLAQGEIEPAIHAVLPFEEAIEAHRMLEATDNFGKIILTV